MSQSRFSIVLVGVSALLRRPLVSRLRPADGERSPWVVFAARVGRFDSGFRSAGWPSGSLLPLFGMRRFGVAAGRVRSSAFRFGDCPRRVGLRAHCFRFSACAVSEWPLGELAFGLTASAFRHAPLRGCPRRVGSSARRVGLRAHCFRFSACTASEWPLGELVLPPSASEIALGGLAFGFTASAFRHAPLRSDPRRAGSSAGRVGLRAHRFRFSACTASEWPLGGWPSGLLLRRLPFGGLAFGLTASEIRLGGLAFGFTASAFRHAPLRSGCWASSFFRLPLRSCRSASLPSGSRLPLFGMHRSAPPRRRSEDRRSTTTRQLFHFKTLIPTC